MRTISVKVAKVCAFCEHWYDPTNSHINPQNTKANMWSFDKYASSKCLKRNINRNAEGYCSYYKCKVPIF